MTDLHHSKQLLIDNEIESNDQDKLVMECQRQFGNVKFIFYFPQNVGNFVVSCWSSIKSIYNGDSNDSKERNLIYENKKLG